MSVAMSLPMNVQMVKWLHVENLVENFSFSSFSLPSLPFCPMLVQVLRQPNDFMR